MCLFVTTITKQTNDIVPHKVRTIKKNIGVYNFYMESNQIHTWREISKPFFSLKSKFDLLIHFLKHQTYQTAST